MKVCTKCKVEKEFSEFIKNKNCKNGLKPQCKQCLKKYYLDNKQKRKEYLEKNKEKIKEQRKEYYKQYYKQNKDKLIQYHKKYTYENNEHLKKYAKQYREKNKEKNKEYKKIYLQKNKNIINKKLKEYAINRRKTDYLFKFKQNIRSNINHCFKRGTNQFKKDAKTETILGCKIEDFLIYIENLFTKDMTIKNYGEWHLDHIIPISTAKNKEDVIKLCHYTNYQPLWAKDNFSKSNKIIQKQLKLI